MMSTLRARRRPYQSARPFSISPRARARSLDRSARALLLLNRIHDVLVELEHAEFLERAVVDELLRKRAEERQGARAESARAHGRASRLTELSCVASIDCWWCPPSETTRRKRSDWPLFIFLMSITWRDRARARPGEGDTRGSSARVEARAHTPPHLDVRVEARVAVRDALERSRGQHVVSSGPKAWTGEDGLSLSVRSRAGRAWGP